MSQYRLIYFNSKGRAELTRFIFAQAGVKYEDKRITKEEWVELKPLTQYGYVPILEEDGQSISGSIVIARYLAEKPEFGLAGSNAIENAQIASLADFLGDLQMQAAKTHYAPDETSKAELIKKLAEEAVPKYIGKLETFSERTREGYLWGNKLTWVDFYAYLLISWINMITPFLDKYPNVKKLTETVENLPNIAKWIKERPVTQF